MRVWEVQFQVYDQVQCFPRPGELVEELQTTPAYRIDELKRLGQQGGQLSCTIDGEGRFREGEKEYVLSPGTAFLARHGLKDLSYFYPPEGSVPWKTLWISFHGGTAENMIDEIVSKYGHIYRLPIEKGVIKRLLAYRNYNKTVQPLTSGAGAKIVMDVLTSLTERDERALLNSPQNDLIRQIQQYMLEHVGEDYGVSDLADALDVSREHLSRFFSSRMEQNLSEYIRQNKIRRACHILRETRYSCGDIGRQVGYRNSASFCRVFKSVTGMTPENFRRVGYIPELETAFP